VNRSHVTRYADALRRTLGWRNLTALGRATRHCRRLREVTPQRLVCSLMEALGSLRVQTVADILRLFNAQTGLNTMNVLRPAVGGKLSHFKDVVVQDGSSFAVHDELRRTFGGRFTTLRPAAVEWDRPGGRTLPLRMILIWHRHKQEYTILVTNVPRRVLTAHQVAEVYRLRRQIELLFKEWKSYANLHEFSSAPIRH